MPQKSKEKKVNKTEEQEAIIEEKLSMGLILFKAPLRKSHSYLPNKILLRFFLSMINALL